MVRIEQLHFAQATPFEALLTRQPAAGQRVLSPLIAKLVRQEMMESWRTKPADGSGAGFGCPAAEFSPIGGKTGTGDNRFHESGKPAWVRAL